VKRPKKEKEGKRLVRLAEMVLSRLEDSIPELEGIALCQAVGLIEKLRKEHSEPPRQENVQIRFSVIGDEEEGGSMT